MADAESAVPRFPVRLWNRLPLAVRATVGGLFVFLVLQSGWNAFAGLNLAHSPAVPWNVPVGLVYLWVVFQFFNGRWGPRSTRNARRQSMRARTITLKERGDVFVASAAVFAFATTYLLLTPRIFPIPDTGIDLSAFPWWTQYSALVMIAIVAGVSEEAGFRGYMQSALEPRYGPGVAIAATALLFALLHLNDPGGPMLLPIIIVVGVAFGALAYCARSILPVIVVHALVDIVMLVGSTAEIGPPTLWDPPLVIASGADAGFLSILTVTALTGIAAVFALRRLAAHHPTHDVHAVESD